MFLVSVTQKRYTVRLLPAARHGCYLDSGTFHSHVPDILAPDYLHGDQRGAG